MIAKRVAILQSSYIPWRGYFDIIRNVDEFVLCDVVQFTKNDWRNRNRTANGLQWLTIPVKTWDASDRRSPKRRSCEALLSYPNRRQPRSRSFS
ncbi:MAG TPA: WbqC family protein [Vicinamibacterales bacterium]|nr:WbqC family protein [Vicinamibacterales bacterium]